MKVWLVMMILDAGSGEVLNERVLRDDFPTDEACITARGVHAERPADGLLVIYDCREAK